MPRQSRGSRPAPRAAPAPAPQQTRGAHTAAAPPVAQHAPPPPVVHQQPQGPGMLAQMAATAGSVAVGSTIGHGLSNMLFGGGSREAAAPAPEPPVQQAQTSFVRSCDFQAKEFTKCLETGDVNSCSWYLEQLKACQATASKY
ncbi:hypothetical protein FRB99_008347 [Tulasnella sp. 403]|nr:hypothetical protein FRB99_008347 [Tulasnella sp. 403]